MNITAWTVLIVGCLAGVAICEGVVQSGSFIISVLVIGAYVACLTWLVLLAAG